MSAVQQLNPEQDLDALTWANDHFPFDHKDLLTDRPWGRTYRLNRGKKIAYLKLLPKNLTNAARTTPKLGELFTDNVPKTIAANQEYGYLLLRDHQGKDLKRDASSSTKRKILRTYATIQGQAAANPDLIDEFPTLDLNSVVEKFLEFLEPQNSTESSDSNSVAASFFIGRQEAAGYYELFSARTDLINSLIAPAAGLKKTINHLDLRPSNVAESKHGQCILYDWEESLAGPAGLSLHAMFSGSYKPILLLTENQTSINPEKLRGPRRLLNAYLDTLTEYGYAKKSELTARLSGSIVAGLMYFLTSYANYPSDSQSYNQTIGDHINKRLGDLLDVCDFLTITTDSEKVFEFAHQYNQLYHRRRAGALIDQYLLHHPQDPHALQTHGQILMSRQADKRAIKSFDEALGICPDDPEIHANIAAAYAKQVNYKAALHHARRSEHIDPNNQEAQKLVGQIEMLNQWYETAAHPGTVPMVEFTDQERTPRRISIGKLELCAALLRKHGVLQMNNVFAPELLYRCRDAFMEQYNRYIKDERHKDALRLGDKRYQVTLALDPPFDDAALVTNPILMRLMRELLSKYFVLGALTSSMSLPGAKEQRLHKDHKSLFPEIDQPGVQPSFAVSVMIPLVDLDEKIGTTRVRKGSHVLTTPESDSLPSQSPIVTVGSCYLMDYRLSHYGQSNQSERTRPIINMVYQRPWFKDYMNFQNQPPVQLSKRGFDAMSKPLRQLLAWTQDPTPE